MGLEDDFLLNDADDEKTIEFIRNYLPQELKEKFSEDELYYFLDLIDEYYSESGILDVQPDADGYVDIDLEQVVEFIVKEAQKDEVGEYDPEDILFRKNRLNRAFIHPTFKQISRLLYTPDTSKKHNAL